MKVGIVTHYYKSNNYGGNLQAYALCKAISNLGHDVEQISFKRINNKSFKHRMYELYSFVKNYKEITVKKSIQARQDAIGIFNTGCIPHSKIYSEKNIEKCVGDYDAFITGSDQVWHPSACCDAYLLKFVPPSKRKISYAASIACDTVSKEYQERLADALKDYDYISLREKNAVSIVDNLTDNSVQCTLDPTLLLSKDEWDSIVEPCNVPKKYLFCYFLGDGLRERQLASEYAERKKLKIVTLPFLLGKYRECDKEFGDFLLYDVSPKNLLYIIKNAEIVFTDSFHATVFSWIFEKEFFVFNRGKNSSMSSRLYSILSIFDCKERFCDSENRTTVEYIETCIPINYAKVFDKFEIEKTKSLNFLKKALCDGSVKKQNKVIKNMGKYDKNI